jgi:peptidoglycan/LPS O-acetylase OafA/YrhL
MTDPRPAAMPVATASGRLPGLDVMRGLAALYVLGFHFAWNYALPTRFFAKGYLAVDLFFMLSGYVMARTYEKRFAEGFTVGRFMVVRYWRLWPIMAVGSLLGVPKLLSETNELTGFFLAAACNLLLLPVPAPYLAFPLNIPAWSIFFELAANLVHALILWRLGARWLLALIVAAVPTVVWVGLHYGTFDLGAHTDHFLAALARSMLSYLIGIVLWRWWRDEPALPFPTILAAAAALATWAAGALSGIADWRLDLLIILVVCPLLLAAGLRYRPSNRMALGIAGGLGALSFPLYATHMPVLEGMKVLGYGWVAGGTAMLLAGTSLALAAEIVGPWRKARRKRPA